MAIFFDTEHLPLFKEPVVTIGTFDGVHKGHQTILKKTVETAQQTGGESLLVTFEPHPRKLLFPKQPAGIITPLHQKLTLISKQGIQHIVVAPFNLVFSHLSAEEYIRDFLVSMFRPKHIIIGYDHKFGKGRSGDIQLLSKKGLAFGYDTYEVPQQIFEDTAVSSTKIRNALKTGQIELAYNMLGRHYNLCGKVAAGNKLGRKLGYPTANLQPNEPEQIIPAKGVYAITAKYKQNHFKGMLNIGNNPTVMDSNEIKIEANLFDFDHEIYGETLDISFVKRLRDEVKFPSLDALKEQLAVDRVDAERALGGG